MTCHELINRGLFSILPKCCPSEQRSAEDVKGMVVPSGSSDPKGRSFRTAPMSLGASRNSNYRIETNHSLTRIRRL